jgi:hypothetical protein
MRNLAKALMAVQYFAGFHSRHNQLSLTPVPWSFSMRKRNWFLIVLSLPAFFFILDLVLIKVEPLEETVIAGKDRYEQRFIALASQTTYCMRLNVARVSPFASNDMYDQYRFLGFGFNWSVLENGSTLLEGDSKSVPLPRLAYGGGTIGMEFACFIAKPFRTYDLTIHLTSIPSTAEVSPLHSSFDLGTAFEVHTGPYQLMFRSFFALVAVVWLIALLTLALILRYRHTPARLTRRRE